MAGRIGDRCTRCWDNSVEVFAGREEYVGRGRLRRMHSLGMCTEASVYLPRPGLSLADSRDSSGVLCT